MTTWLYLYIFIIFSTYLAKLKRRAHLTVQLILLLRDLNVVVRSGFTQACEIRVITAPVWKQIKSFSASIDECLEQWFIMWDGLQDVSITSDIANGPLA